MSFQSFAEPLDPDAVTDYTFPLRLPAGESLADAVVEFVNSTSTAEADPAPAITIESQSFGQISGTLWGVTVWLAGNGAAPGKYYLRVRGETDSFPIPRRFDCTMRLDVKQR